MASLPLKLPPWWWPSGMPCCPGAEPPCRFKLELLALPSMRPLPIRPLRSPMEPTPRSPPPKPPPLLIPLPPSAPGRELNSMRVPAPALALALPLTAADAPGGLDAAPPTAGRAKLPNPLPRLGLLRLPPAAAAPACALVCGCKLKEPIVSRRNASLALALAPAGAAPEALPPAATDATALEEPPTARSNPSPSELIVWCERDVAGPKLWPRDICRFPADAADASAPEEPSGSGVAEPIDPERALEALPIGPLIGTELQSPLPMPVRPPL